MILSWKPLGQLSNASALYASHIDPIRCCSFGCLWLLWLALAALAAVSASGLPPTTFSRDQAHYQRQCRLRRDIFFFFNAPANLSLIIISFYSLLKLSGNDLHETTRRHLKHCADAAQVEALKKAKQGITKTTSKSFKTFYAFHTLNANKWTVVKPD